MQRIADIMTRDVTSVAPEETIRRAAELMDDLNIGALPVCNGEELVGMITDRDITVRATAQGMAPDETAIEDVMTSNVTWCYDDQEVDEVMGQMADSQLRRIPVIDHNTRKLIGIVSLGDVATKHSAGVDRTLEDVSSPSRPNTLH
ncbi:CBS domain-containing protein [Noviherbaspirillum galbum]|uniref:CBS domain-containing protein n=1 Tax=Noviherbaspirillum galbum TaxID=2709383 RepID=A0A6B3SRR1_9BURK|nr:CBS domain-containing protein [Noviherbaspirillum galbum]NEX61122.1 CBS domain-containing protein [Noviherbaspirillum galbum]